MRVFSATLVIAAALALASTAAGQESELGKTVYAKRCASCHGADGKGNAKMEAMLKTKIPALTATAKTDAEIHQLLVEGKKPMPSFKSLTKEEMDAVTAYTKALSKVAGGK